LEIKVKWQQREKKGYGLFFKEYAKFRGTLMHTLHNFEMGIKEENKDA
jgi:hypothetical protein